MSNLISKEDYVGSKEGNPGTVSNNHSHTFNWSLMTSWVLCNSEGNGQCTADYVHKGFPTQPSDMD